MHRLPQEKLGVWDLGGICGCFCASCGKVTVSLITGDPTLTRQCLSHPQTFLGPEEGGSRGARFPDRAEPEVPARKPD